MTDIVVIVVVKSGVPAACGTRGNLKVLSIPGRRGTQDTGDRRPHQSFDIGFALTLLVVAQATTLLSSPFGSFFGAVSCFL
jgi:hypothetical protein